MRRDDEAVFDSIGLSHLKGNPPAVVRLYRGLADEASSDFAREASVFAANGYLPVSQQWADGAWNSTTVMLAVFLSIFAVGVLFLAYMLVASPDGTLSVTYRPSAASSRP